MCVCVGVGGGGGECVWVCGCVGVVGMVVVECVWMGVWWMCVCGCL